MVMTKLKPMILKDIADMVGLDISTISRGQSKYVETPYGTKLIKEFFSESMKTIKVKMFLHSKSRKSFRIRLKKKTRKPFPDDQLAEILKRKAIQSQEEPLQNTENNSIFQWRE
jgi:RNA polymerase sigma-54 factor